jgi:hypothetical protein
MVYAVVQGDGRTRNICCLSDFTDPPKKDTSTPMYLSELFLKRINRVPTKVVMLKNPGDYPLEEPGLTQMCNAVVNFIHLRCFTKLNRNITSL